MNKPAPKGIEPAVWGPLVEWVTATHPENAAAEILEARECSAAAEALLSDIRTALADVGRGIRDLNELVRVIEDA